MNFLLVLHLIGAAAAAVLVVASLAAVLVRRASLYHPFARAVAALGLVQIVTGALLSWVAGATLLSFCVRVGTYLAVLTVVEVVLLVAMRRAEAASATAK